MALVVLLRGINVGGHRAFRPTTLARELRHLDIVNIGSAGTFVVRAPITAARLRAEVARRLPFDAEIVICRGQQLVRLLAEDHFAAEPARPDVVRFVSVLAGRPRAAPSLPARIPARGPWLMKILARDGRFVVGVHRREMRAIRGLGTLDRLFGTTCTTRSSTTMAAVAKVLASRATT
ncbi:MAG: DUF1697 domain-containing protein [Planctomycetes bacterium]|nr:DUF1697 domain-containing protein [Planctomycetota bacterium]